MHLLSSRICQEVMCARRIQPSARDCGGTPQALEIQELVEILRVNGEGGIRTRGTLTGTRHFQCRPIGHSGTSPGGADANIIAVSPGPTSALPVCDGFSCACGPFPESRRPHRVRLDRKRRSLKPLILLGFLDFFVLTPLSGRRNICPQNGSRTGRGDAAMDCPGLCRCKALRISVTSPFHQVCLS